MEEFSALDLMDDPSEDPAPEADEARPVVDASPNSPILRRPVLPEILPEE
jgi:hypothetical protein